MIIIEDLENSVTYTPLFSLRASGMNHTFETCRDAVLEQYGRPLFGDGQTFAVQNGKCFIQGVKDTYKNSPWICGPNESDGVNHVYTIKGQFYF